MKILQWMQKRLNGNHEKKKPSSSSVSATNYMVNEPCKQEFSDWPQALLAIGTFGTNNQKEDSEKTNIPTAEEDSLCFQDSVEKFTLNLQNELKIYFRGLEDSNNFGAEHEEEEEDKNHNDLINNKRLNSENSSLDEHEGKEEKGNEALFCSDGSNIIKSVNFYPNNSVMYIRGKDRCLDKVKSGVAKKSLSFLLKKMFICRNGFEPIPPLSKEPLSTESRMEKILREILHKKMYPQGSSSTMFIKKYLEDRPVPHSDNDDYDDEEEEEFTSDADKRCKWVKTDDEYIVLEI